MAKVKQEIRIKGKMSWELRDEKGRIKSKGSTSNLVTTNGDNYCAALLHSAPTTMDDMKLGTADTAPAKAGAGSYIAVADYVAGSAQACDEASPKAGASSNIVQFIRTWAAGVATNATINRVAIVNNTTDAGEGDATGTLAIALFDPRPIAKGAVDSLKVQWDITFLGA